MRYDDASQAGSMATDSAPTAHADVDALPAGGYGASGNAITGAGTISGSAGADSVANGPARIVEVHGSGGSTTESGSGFQAPGQYGVLTMDAQGNFNYARSPNTPEGVQDVFGYTIADRNGATSSTTLTMGIGPSGPGQDAAAIAAAAGVVNLPPGVQMSDIRVNGRDLVINMPDGTQMVIPGGAVFVPQLVIGDVEVPANNLAALLVDSEPQPAAGSLQSSGGNFAAPVPPLDPGVPLGDLIPPTELTYTPPEFEEVNQFEDDEPEIVIIPDGQPAAVNAVDSVDEAGLPARDGDLPGEPEGSGEEAAAGADGDTSEHTSGVISIDADDGIDSVTINGEEVTEVGQEIEGEQGILTITSINFATGQIGYTYLLTDNTNPGGDNISDLFTVTVTDEDGDTATATLTIDIIDDTPIARDDTDALGIEDQSTDGNVMTGAGTTSGASGKDTVGADDATLTGIHPGTGGSFTSVPQDGSGILVHGTFGDLVIHDDGSYEYTRTTEEGGTDVFTYQLTDGDGDTETATLTITVPNIDHPVEILDLTPAAQGGDAIVDEDDLSDGSDTSKESTTVGGNFKIVAPDGVDDLTVGGFAVITNGVFQPGSHVTPLGNTLTFTSYDPATGVISYTYTLNDNETHPDDNGGQNSIFEDFNVVLTDTDGDSDTDTLSVQIVDDVPTAVDDGPIAVPEDAPVTFSVFGNDVFGADGVDTDNNPAVAVTFTQASKGTVTYDPNTGQFTYTPDQGAEGTDSFTYTITDGDGDPSTATVTLTLAPDSTPQIGTPDNVSVDEDGLVGANPDNGEPGEVAHGNDDTGTGQVIVSYGNDVPGNLLNAIEFLDPGTSLDSELTQDGEPIEFSLDGSGNLVGRVNGVGSPVITISFTGAVAGPGAGQVTYTYTVELDGPVDQDIAGTEDSVVLDNVQFQVTDSDGSVSDPSSFDVTIYDDVPTARDDGPINVPEDGQSTFGVFGNDSFGIDGVDTDNNPLPASVTFTQGAKGTVSYNATTGEFTYTANTGEEGADSFTYTIIDADGDPSTATVTINIGEDSTPQIGEAPTLTVDEDGLGTANNDNGGTIADEDPHGNNLTDSDTVVVDFGNDVPADEDAAIVFINASNLNNQLTQNGLPITFSINGSGQIIGQVNGVGPAVVTISLTGGTDNGDGTVTYGYSVTLAGPVDQAYPNGDQDENGITLTGVEFQVTDSDGSTASDTFDVTIFDDVPTAVDDTDEVNEGSTQTAGNVITGVGGDGDAAGADSKGADDAEVTGVVSVFNGNSDTDAGGGGYIVIGHYGTLTLQPGGGYTYVLTAAGQTALNALGDGETLTDTFTYTLTDNDGDFDTANLVITLNGANDPPSVTGATVRVSEEGLTNGNEDTTGFPTNAADTTNDATISGQVTVSDPDASDTVTVTLSNPPSNLTSCGEEVYWEGSGTNTLNAFADIDGIKTPIMTITIDNDGNYTVTLLHGVDHPSTAGEDALPSFNITITADDGTDTATSNLNITIEDDSPVAFSPTDGAVDNEAGPESADIPLNFAAAAGGDGVGDVVFQDSIDGDPVLDSGGAQLTFEGENLHWVLVDDHTLEARTDADVLGFTIRLDPENDSYTIDLEGPIFNIEEFDFTDLSGVKGGNENFVALGVDTPLQSQDILISGSDTVNTNDNNIGIGAGQNIEGSEVIKFEFKSNIVIDAGDPSGFSDDGFYQAFEYIQEIDVVSGAPHNTAGFTITIANALGGAPGDVTVEVYDGDPDAGGTLVTSVTDNADGSVVVPDGFVEEGYFIKVTSTDPFTSVQYSNNTGDPYKLGIIQVQVANTLEEFDVNVPITGTDCDGDAVNSQIDITFNPVVDTLALTSLMSSNDNELQQRAFNAGNTAALMGAVAAAGLASTSAAASDHNIDRSSHESVSLVDAKGGSVDNTVQVEQGVSGRESFLLNNQQSDDPATSGESRGSHSAHQQDNNSVSDGDSASPVAVSELAQGTDSPASDAGSQSVFTSQAVVMPGAELLAAAKGEGHGKGVDGQAASVEGGAQHNQDVGKVLADALSGGGHHGPDLDALIDAVSQNGGGNHAGKGLEALASHGAGSVPNGDMAIFAGFTGHGMHAMDPMTMHQDAAPSNG